MQCIPLIKLEKSNKSNKTQAATTKQTTTCRDIVQTKFLFACNTSGNNIWPSASCEYKRVRKTSHILFNGQ